MCKVEEIKQMNEDAIEKLKAELALLETELSKNKHQTPKNFTLLPSKNEGSVSWLRGVNDDRFLMPSVGDHDWSGEMQCSSLVNLGLEEPTWIRSSSNLGPKFQMQ